MNKFITISSSIPGRSIIFITKEEFDAYDTEILAVIKKHKKLQQDKYGYWATNKEIFVHTLKELSEWDSKSYYV